MKKQEKKHIKSLFYVIIVIFIFFFIKGLYCAIEKNEEHTLCRF